MFIGPPLVYLYICIFGIFVYKLITSIETGIVLSGIFVFSKKLRKRVVSFRYDFVVVL